MGMHERGGRYCIAAARQACRWDGMNGLRKLAAGVKLTIGARAIIDLPAAGRVTTRRW